MWAFGVTAWEIYSFGEAPYKGIMQLDQQFIDSVKMGMRLQKPSGAPDEMLVVILVISNMSYVRASMRIPLTRKINLIELQLQDNF